MFCEYVCPTTVAKKTAGAHVSAWHNRGVIVDMKHSKAHITMIVVRMQCRRRPGLNAGRMCATCPRSTLQLCEHVKLRASNVIDRYECTTVFYYALAFQNINFELRHISYSNTIPSFPDGVFGRRGEPANGSVRASIYNGAAIKSSLQHLLHVM
jgi:hypothetical protein